MKKVVVLIALVLCLHGASTKELIAQAGKAFNDKEYDKAVNYFAEACDNGDTDGCINLAVLYDRGWGIQKDLKKAVIYYTKACDGGEAMGCTGLGVFYKEGRILQQDYTKSFELFSKGCDGGDYQGCVNMGTLYENGLGVKKDIDKAQKIYANACSNTRGDKEPSGCINLGELYERHLNYYAALEAYTVSCDRSVADGCYKIGMMYSTGIGHSRGVPQDTKLATIYFEKACNFRSADACNDLAQAYEFGINVPTSKNKAKNFYKKACKLKSDRGCAGYQRLEK